MNRSALEMVIDTLLEEKSVFEPKSVPVQASHPELAAFWVSRVTCTHPESQTRFKAYKLQMGNWKMEAKSTKMNRHLQDSNLRSRKNCLNSFCSRATGFIRTISIG